MCTEKSQIFRKLTHSTPKANTFSCYVMINSKNKERKKCKTMKNKKLYIPALITVGVLAIGGVVIAANATGNKDTEESTVYKETTVEKGNLTTGITESGNTELGTSTFSYDIGSVSVSSSGSSSSGSSSSGSGSTGSSSSGGSSSAGAGSSGSSSSGSSSSVSTELEIEEVYVDASQSVASGDKILKVTDESYQKVLQNLNDAVTTAELNLTQAKIDRSLEQISADNTYSENKSKAETANASYNNTITKLQNSVDKAKKEMDNAAQEMADAQTILDTYTDYTDEQLEALSEAADEAKEKGDQAAYQTAKNTYDTAKNSAEAIDKAQETLDSLESSYPNLQIAYEEALVSQKEGILEAKAKLEEELVTAENAGSLYNIAINGIDDEVDDAQEELDNAKTVLAAFQEMVKDGVMSADFDGMITEISCEAGDSLSSGTAILTYANADQVTLTVSVDQEDIASVALNDEVNIAFTAYNGTAYKGVVTAISTSASSGNSSTVSYPVTVTVSGDVSALYAGMTGNVTFVTKEIENVVYVSNKAIQTEGTKSYVKKKNSDGETEKVEVETGFSDGNNVEITSGLNEGDTVLIESQVKSK